jgi:CHAD domain-containing protein
MKPVRKAAGVVRDIDVLVADALTLPNAAKNESIVRLVERGTRYNPKTLEIRSVGKIRSLSMRDRSGLLLRFSVR